jgi:hypothetical protein
MTRATGVIMALAHAAAAALGVFAAQSAWHTALGAQVQGWDYTEGRIFAAALVAGAVCVIASRVVGIRGGPWAAGLGALTGLGAVGRYAWRVHDAQRTIADTLEAVGIPSPRTSDGLELGFWVAVGAGLVMLALSGVGISGEGRCPTAVGRDR